MAGHRRGLVDVLSEHFVFQTGADTDALVSEGGGSAAVLSDQAVWNLSGCSTGAVHTLTLKVRLADGTEMDKSGVLPTNKSLGAAGGIVTDAQPELERYLVNYRFINGDDPQAQLPRASSHPFRFFLLCRLRYRGIKFYAWFLTPG